MKRKEFLASLLVLLQACKHETVPPAIEPTPSQILLLTIDLEQELLQVGDILNNTARGIFIKRIATGNFTNSFICFSMECTHSGCIINLQTNGNFNCPCHGSVFSHDGTVINGPAARPLDKFKMEVNGKLLLVRK